MQKNRSNNNSTDPSQEEMDLNKELADDIDIMEIDPRDLDYVIKTSHFLYQGITRLMVATDSKASRYQTKKIQKRMLEASKEQLETLYSIKTKGESW